MSSGNRKRIVVNSHRFFRDISPAVLAELEFEEDLGFYAGQGDPELYSTVKLSSQRIILTERLRQEYIREAVKEGFPVVLVEPVIERLKSGGLVVEPRLPGGNHSFPGIPKWHDVFPITAILARADYLITEYPVWQRRADTISQYGPIVISASGFVQRESI